MIWLCLQMSANGRINWKINWIKAHHMAIYDQTGVWKWGFLYPQSEWTLFWQFGVSHGRKPIFGQSQIVVKLFVVEFLRLGICLTNLGRCPNPLSTFFSTGRDHWKKNVLERPYWRVYRMWKYNMLYISYHILSYHIISYHIISYHIIPHHIISNIISYQISYHIISYIISYITSYIYISLALDVVILWHNFSHGPGGEARTSGASVLATAACPVQSSSFGSHDRQSSAGDIGFNMF